MLLWYIYMYFMSTVDHFFDICNGKLRTVETLVEPVRILANYHDFMYRPFNFWWWTMKNLLSPLLTKAWFQRITQRTLPWWQTTTKILINSYTRSLLCQIIETKVYNDSFIVNVCFTLLFLLITKSRLILMLSNIFIIRQTYTYCKNRYISTIFRNYYLYWAKIINNK